MRILVACEESGTVTKAFRDKGHEAWSCDIQPTSGELPEYHIQGDVTSLLHQNWDMLIAFPPCTYLSRASARFMYPKGKLNIQRYNKALEAKAFFMFLYNAPIKHIAIENPTQFKILNMPEYTQAIQPYMFGHPYSKRTLLWLKNLPALLPTKYVKEYTPFVKSSSHRGKYQPPTKTAKERSKTFKGIALAMASQWSHPIYEEQLTLF